MSGEVLHTVADKEAIRWPRRIISLGRALRTCDDSRRREQITRELWTLVHLGLTRYVRHHSPGTGAVTYEESRDIAAQKLLDLYEKAKRSDWDPALSEPGQLCRFLSTLARNGVVDHMRSGSLRRKHRRLPIRRPEADKPQDAPRKELLRMLFPRALIACIRVLRPRARTVWVYRVFYDLPTKTIARHPAVRMSPAAVDMALARSRRAIRRCMRSKGLDVRSLPPGTFATLWETFVTDAGTKEEPGGTSSWTASRPI